MKKIRGRKSGFSDNLRSNKRAQVTIFIIFSIIIVFIISLYFFYIRPEFENTSAKKPQIERCIEKELNAKIKNFGLTAGVKNPTFTTMYLDENYTFICYTEDYYKPCVVQQPFLVENFEKVLRNSMESSIQKCYDDAISDLKAQGYDITSGKIKSDITINPDGVRIEIDAPTTFSNDRASSKMSKVNVNLYSDLYNVLIIANSILQFESSYGDSDVSSFMFYYPDISVQKIRRDDSVKLYIITNKKDIKYRFATRSYAWPPGYGNALN